MTVYDLYGCMSTDIEGAKEILESTLDIQFDIGHSDYQGGKYYKWQKIGDENFVLKRNADPFDGEPAEMSFAIFPILFYLNDTKRSGDLQVKMKQEAKEFALLRREDFA